MKLGTAMSFYQPYNSILTYTVIHPCEALVYYTLVSLRLILPFIPRIPSVLPILSYPPIHKLNHKNHMVGYGLLCHVRLPSSNFHKIPPFSGRVKTLRGSRFGRVGLRRGEAMRGTSTDANSGHSLRACRTGQIGANRMEVGCPRATISPSAMTAPGPLLRGVLQQRRPGLSHCRAASAKRRRLRNCQADATAVRHVVHHRSAKRAVRLG
jgi:hypothetical protein